MRSFKISLVVIGASALLVGATELPALSPYVRAMQGADQLTATFSVTEVGGATMAYSIAMAKPNKLFLETPSSISVADGSQITFFDKSQKMYYKTQQTPEKLMSLLGGDEVVLWKAFFDAKALDAAKSAKNEGKKQRGTRSLNVIAASFDAKSEYAMKIYTDASTNLLAQAQLTTPKGGASSSRVLNVESLETSVASNAFTFTPPAGAKEMSEEDLMVGKWFHDWDQAIKVSKATGKLMMVDFYATWCGPCKMMDAEVFQTEQFKNSTRDFVLVKIDAEIETGLARKYGIEAYPTVKFINGDGAVVHQYVGYGGPQQVYNEVATARSKK